MKRSTRLTLFAGSLALAEVIEFIALFFFPWSSHFFALSLVTIIAMVVEWSGMMKSLRKANFWRAREDRFFNATGHEAPHSYKEVEAMKAINEQVAGLFIPVRDAMTELAQLKRQRLTVFNAKRCAKLEEEIRKGREHYTKGREAALPFLTLPFRLISERKLSEALNERLRRPPIPFRPR